MYLDKFTQVSSAQELNAAAVSEDYYDRGATNADMGFGEPLGVLMHVAEAFNTLTSLEVSLISATATDLTTGQIKHTTKSIPLASLTLNSIHFFPFTGKTHRYVGVDYAITGSNCSTGIVNTWIIYGSGYESNRGGALA